jgi:hypothetical protein
MALPSPMGQYEVWLPQVEPAAASALTSVTSSPAVSPNPPAQPPSSPKPLPKSDMTVHSDWKLTPPDDSVRCGSQDRCTKDQKWRMVATDLTLIASPGRSLKNPAIECNDGVDNKLCEYRENPAEYSVAQDRRSISARVWTWSKSVQLRITATETDGH